jgi:putative ABC transport system permease protein
MALPLSYHWRNLFVRKTTTLLTLLVIAAVVGVFSWMIGFAAALERSLATAADDHKLVVLKRGSTAESNSALPVEEYNRLSQLTDVAHDPATNAPLISPEMMVQVSLPRIRDRGKTSGNVAVRGVTKAAFAVHTNVRASGGTFSEAEPQVIVGRSAAEQFAGLQVGDSVNLGFGNDRAFRVVGHFTADGGPMESEIWGYLPSLLNAYNRTMYSSAWARLAAAADPQEVIDRIKGPAIQLEAQTEAQYWMAQSQAIRRYLFVAYVLVFVMALAAVFSIANTTFAMVAGRTREIAMLRTIGYSGRHILSGFVIESVVLSLLGGAAGCAGCLVWLNIEGNTKDMFGASTFTTLAFKISLTPQTAGAALLLVTAVGMAGALIPAWRASRIGVVEALREP